MMIFDQVVTFREWRKKIPMSKTVGFVPTMGALHEGHAQLLRKARTDNDLVVLSIFVNPTQFNQTSDLVNYPKTWESDLELARAAGVDAILAPLDSRELYPDDYRFQVVEKEFSKELCGAFRPGHFDGVLSVVMKLFQITQPTRAYFGRKDRQQLELIRGMVDAFWMDLQIVPVETVREESGLALSSRNLRLKPEDRELAPRLHRVMTQVADLAAARAQLESDGFRVEYLEDRGSPGGKTIRYAAAWLGEVRLIDNVDRE